MLFPLLMYIHMALLLIYSSIVLLLLLLLIGEVTVE